MLVASQVPLSTSNARHNLCRISIRYRSSPTSKNGHRCDSPSFSPKHNDVTNITVTYFLTPRFSPFRHRMRGMCIVPITEILSNERFRLVPTWILWSVPIYKIGSIQGLHKNVWFWAKRFFQNFHPRLRNFLNMAIYVSKIDFSSIPTPECTRTYMFLRYSEQFTNNHEEWFMKRDDEVMKTCKWVQNVPIWSKLFQIIQCMWLYLIIDE